MRFQDRRRHSQLESGFSTQTAMSRAAQRRYTEAVQFASRLPTRTRSRTGGGRPGRPDGKSLHRIGGVTAMDSEEHGGPPPTVRKAPSSMRRSSVVRNLGSVRSSSAWCKVSMQSTHGHPRDSILRSHRRDPAKSERARWGPWKQRWGVREKEGACRKRRQAREPFDQD